MVLKAGHTYKAKYKSRLHFEIVCFSILVFNN